MEAIPKNQSEIRRCTDAAVTAAGAAWAKAPAHIKAMAGAYVGPLMAAIAAIHQEIKGRRE